MSKAKVLLILAFLLVFAAGAVVGTVREVPIPWGQQAPHPRGPFDPLHLTDQQREQMKGIWSHVDELRRNQGPKWHELRRQRDQEIRGLMSTDQLKQYDQIENDFRQRLHELDLQFEQAVHQAEDQTRQILTPQQQQKFDQMRREHAAHRMPMPRRGRGPGPATRPAPQ